MLKVQPYRNINCTASDLSRSRTVTEPPPSGLETPDAMRIEQQSCAALERLDLQVGRAQRGIERKPPRPQHLGDVGFAEFGRQSGNAKTDWKHGV